MKLNKGNLILLSILIIWPKIVDSSCELSNFGKDKHDICVGDIKCDKDVNNFDEKLDGWSCRRSEYQEYDRYYDTYRRRTRLEDNYNINLKLSDINSSDDTFRILSNSRATHVIKLKVNNVNIVNVPPQINTFNQVVDIDLSNNKIESIDLSKFLGLNKLKTVNFSHNAISTLEVDSENSLRTSGLTSIDLSYNLIEAIPNNYFIHYRQLQYLDLSYNFINSFNMITFEGLMNLQTLHVSHNNLNSLGYTLTRFVNLIELNLDHNLLSSIFEPNFIAMSKLQRLNLSSNCIKTIENKAFNALIDLVELDLGYNEIDVITRELFKNNSKLQSLSLSHNKIEQIETGAFENNTITRFQIDNNSLIINILEKRTFKGIYVNSLDLSRVHIKTLGPETFSVMNTTLLSLNLSGNSINNISISSFRYLYLLTELDLSNNNLSDVAMETNDLKNLTLFFLQNNNIQKIRHDTFSNLSSLTKLDLSSNSINVIELQSFDELKKLEVLILKHNKLVNIVEAHTFQGLISLQTIDIMNTNIRSYENYVFSDTKFLKQLNFSHGQLSFIGFNILKRCDSLEILDFSYNLLESFVINTTTIARVNEIHLNNNKIIKVSNETFTGLSSLRILHLSNNNIINLEPKSFDGLHNLMHLYLFSNPDMEISNTSFNNLSLIDLSLEHVKRNFNFQFTTNASVTSLKLQQCGIVNISTVYVFKIANVQKLNLRSNEIAILDKSSFHNMPYLVWLDLSFNKITYIQPGSFVNTNMINVLDLNSNYIQYLQYGVLDGLKNIRQLNLSNNVIHSFGANLLHNSPYIENIYLDDNVIQFINFYDFIAIGIKSISIGGNLISCDTFVKLKNETNVHFDITTAKEDFNSENVEGITCRTIFNNTKELDHIFLQNKTDTIGPVLAELSNSIENLRVSIEVSNNKTVPNESLAVDRLSKIMSNFQDVIFKLDKTISNETNNLRSHSKVLDKFIETSNKSQISNNKYMYQLVYILNETLFQIESMNEKNKNKSFDSEANIDDEKSRLTLLEETLKRIISEDRDALKNYMNGSIQNIQKSNLIGKELDKDILMDVKLSLSLILICLALILVCVVCYILFKCYIFRKRLISNDIHSSSQPIQLYNI